MAKKTAEQKTRSTKKKSAKGCSFCVACSVGFILVAFGLTALNFSQFVFKHREHFVHGPGQYALNHISNDINTILCHAYEVNLIQPADVYLHHGHARVNRHQKTESKRHTAELDPGSGRLNNAVYLLEGSEIHVNGCKDIQPFYNDDTAQIFVFKGDKSYRLWSEGKCPDCAEKRLDILLDDYCGGSNARMSFKVRHRDTYYIALYKDNEVFSGFEAEATIKSTTFDHSNVIESCQNSNFCYFKLKYGSGRDVTVEFGQHNAFNFRTECKKRTMFWVGIFAILPGVMVFVLLGCCCCCMCKVKTKKGKVAPYSDDKSPLVGPTDSLKGKELPPDYDSIAHARSIQVA